MTVPGTDYDQLWHSTWGEIQQLGPVHRHIREDLVRLVRSLDVRTVLDVGCGSGENLAHLAPLRRHELTGTDVSETALDLARRRVPSARFVPLDIQRAKLDARFDLVLTVQVVEHLPDDAAALRNMAAMTSRYLFVSTMAGRMRRSERAIGHVRNYVPLELRRKMDDAGLEVMWVRGWGFPFYSPLYRTIAEWLPGGPPSGRVGGASRAVAALLYQLYRLNLPGRGDVLSALARRRG